MKIDYTPYLSKFYPSSREFKTLLPKGNPSGDTRMGVKIRGKIDLSSYGLKCCGFLGIGGYAVCYEVAEHHGFGQHYACKIASLDAPSLNGASPLLVAQKTVQEIRIMKRLCEQGTPGVMPLAKFYPSENEIERIIQELKQNPRKAERKHYKILQLTPLAVPYSAFLDTLYKSRRKLSTKEAAAILLDVIEAIYAIHKKGLLHRDLKPDNLYLMKENGVIRVVVADFNISRKISNTNKKIPITVGGTSGYASPYLQARQQKGYVFLDRNNALRLDVYSIGALAYQILNSGQMSSKQNGRIPYPKNSPSDEFSRFVIRLLEPDVTKAPSVEQVIETLYRFFRYGTAQNKNNNYQHKNREQHQPTQNNPKSKTKYIYV